MKKILPFLLFSLGVVSLGFSQENAAQTAISSISDQNQPSQPASFSLFLDETEKSTTPTNWEALQLELDQKIRL